MRYRLHTLLILLAVAPPMLAGVWLAGQTALSHYRQRQQPSAYLRQIGLGLQIYSGDDIWLKLLDGRPAYMAVVPLPADESKDK